MSNLPLYSSLHSFATWWGAASGEREVAEPRTVGVDRLLVADEGHRAIGDVLGEVVALFGQARLVDRFAIEIELRVPLARVAAEEAVEAIEAEDGAARPPVVRPLGPVSSEAVLCHLPSANDT